MISFVLRPMPPFRLDLTAWVLRRLPINEMDLWNGHEYRRVVVIRGEPVEVSVVQVGPDDAPELLVTAEGAGSAVIGEADIAPLVTRLLGLEIDLRAFYRLADSDRRLRDLTGQFVGFKPPRFASVFEALVNGIACQQISLIVGITVLNRLTAHYGVSAGKHHAFPRPEDMVDVSIEDLKALGFSGRKAQNIINISRWIVDGELDLGEIEKLDDRSAASALCDIPGIGRWTAQYVELRGMGRLDVFPADDVGAQSNLQISLGLKERPDYEAIHRIIDGWSPYRGMIYFYLLLNSQARRGLL